MISGYKMAKGICDDIGDVSAMKGISYKYTAEVEKWINQKKKHTTQFEEYGYWNIGMYSTHERCVCVCVF